MIRFHMVDILPLLPVEQPKGNKSSYYIPCPCCDGNRTRNGHLNINLAKDVFRCPRCGFAGGVLDFYAYYANISRDEAREAIASKLHIDDPKGGKTRIVERKPPVIKENPLADIDTRDATYRAFLSKLTLASDHMANLLGRGLPEQIIAVKAYRTTPIVGWKAMARRLHEEGYYLAGVPGFYRGDDGEWTLAETKRGILIPVRDLHGRIQGLQVRRDDVKKRKFRWISSRERSDGCGMNGCTHLAGMPCEEILLVEGPMKADIINYLTGLTVLAVPGVNSLTQLQTSLNELMEQGVKRVMTSFDMDMMINFSVQNGYSALLSLLDSMGLEYGTYLWDPHYNGLDDYVWKYCLQQTKG